MYKVSIVVPVYNVEKYIIRCAESLFQQTLDSIQFIFVNDLSPDNSIPLLEKTLERYPQRKPQTIILHHPKNMGLPTARATGIIHAEAPYVIHCDSDDYVEPTMCAKLYEHALQNNSDMVICGRIVHSINGREFLCFDKPTPDDSLLNNCLNGRLSPVVWGRLIKTDICRLVHYPTENYFEDRVQTVQLLTYAKRISFLNEPLYHYNRHSNSITTNKRPEVIGENIRQCIANYNLMHEFIIKNKLAKEQDFALNKTYIRKLFLPLIKQRNIRKQYLQTFPELNFSMLFNRNISLFDKGVHLLVLFGLYPLAKPLYNLSKKYYYRIVHCFFAFWGNPEGIKFAVNELVKLMKLDKGDAKFEKEDQKISIVGDLMLSLDKEAKPSEEIMLHTVKGDRLLGCLTCAAPR